MFQCQICGIHVPPNTPAQTVVVKREKSYPERRGANPGFTIHNGKLKKSNKWKDRKTDLGGNGWEISKEIKVCPECKEKDSQN